jgi:hypothetical protein
VSDSSITVRLQSPAVEKRLRQRLLMNSQGATLQINNSCPLSLCTGECYYFKPPALRDVDALDPHMACEHFNQVLRPNLCTPFVCANPVQCTGSGP